MQEAVKSKFEQTILGNLTPDGKLLDLENKNIGPEELRLLCDADYLSSDLASVEQLFLSQNQLCGESIEILSRVKGFTGLVSLYLNNNKIGDDDAKFLANAELLKNLKCLMLEANNIGPKGAEALASSPNFKKMEVLFLLLSLSRSRLETTFFCS